LVCTLLDNIYLSHIYYLITTRFVWYLKFILKNIISKFFFSRLNKTVEQSLLYLNSVLSTSVAEMLKSSWKKVTIITSNWYSCVFFYCYRYGQIRILAVFHPNCIHASSVLYRSTDSYYLRIYSNILFVCIIGQRMLFLLLFALKRNSFCFYSERYIVAYSSKNKFLCINH